MTLLQVSIIIRSLSGSGSPLDASPLQMMGTVSHLRSAGQARHQPTLLPLMGMESGPFGWGPELGQGVRAPWGTPLPCLHLCAELDSRPGLGPRALGSLCPLTSALFTASLWMRS